jgi:hypothetical protein
MPATVVTINKDPVLRIKLLAVTILDQLCKLIPLYQGHQGLEDSSCFHINENSDSHGQVLLGRCSNYNLIL